MSAEVGGEEYMSGPGGTMYDVDIGSVTKRGPEVGGGPFSQPHSGSRVVLQRLDVLEPLEDNTLDMGL